MNFSLSNKEKQVKHQAGRKIPNKPSFHH